MNRMAVLMSSCDAYEDLWYPFYTCFDRFWKDIPYSVYLNTEHKIYNDRDNSFTVTTINQKSEKNLSWSKRFLDALDQIEEEYIFLILDDFFLCDSIDNQYFEQIMDEMDKDPEIASFQLYGTRIRNKHPEKYKASEQLIYRLVPESGWKTHFVPTVWRKSVLKKWLRPWESIWAFEECGSKRARIWHYPEKVYQVQMPPVYDYLWIKDCSAVVNGKWIKEPKLIDFFRSNNIMVNYDYRGMMTFEEYQAIDMSSVIKRYSWSQIIIKCINRFRSMW